VDTVPVHQSVDINGPVKDLYLYRTCSETNGQMADTKRELPLSPPETPASSAGHCKEVVFSCAIHDPCFVQSEVIHYTIASE
jgi:hypothetical protein